VVLERIHQPFYRPWDNVMVHGVNNPYIRYCKVLLEGSFWILSCSFHVESDWVSPNVWLGKRGQNYFPLEPVNGGTYHGPGSQNTRQ
jgi:hypothetical protein